MNTAEQLSQKTRLGRKNVKQVFYVGADAVQLIDASRKKYDAGLRCMSGYEYLSIDPVGFTPSSPVSFNRYAYANLNPNKYDDPDGEFANFIAGALIGAAVDLAFQAVNVANGGEFNAAQFVASTAAGAITSGGSAIIASTSIKAGSKIAATAVLGGTANAAATVGANKAINGQSTSLKQTATAFAAGALGAGLGSAKSLGGSSQSQSKLSQAITGNIDATTNVGSMAGNTAAANAASNAARGAAAGQAVVDSTFEAGAKAANIGLDNALDEDEGVLDEDNSNNGDG